MLNRLLAAGVDAQRLRIGALVWITVFLSFELPAHFIKKCPWPTLSRTVWDAIRWWHPLAYFVVLFVGVLLCHLEFRWSAGWLIATGLLGAILIALHVYVR